MKAFAELTHLGQVRRLRQLAQVALEQFGLGSARYNLIGYSENATFRVHAPGATHGVATGAPYVADRFVLRVHRPGHQTAETLTSELAWLWALRHEASLPVPEPVPSLGGELLVQASVPGIPGSRNCSLLRWVRGRRILNRFRPSHFRALGRLIARLHDHATSWHPSSGFARRHWDWEGLFGDDAGFDLCAHDVWALLPRPYRKPFEAVASQVRQVMSRWGKGPDAFALIHADLFLGEEGNVLFHKGQARPVDFDDCGFGYWVYDLAVPLAHWQTSRDWFTYRDALLGGYAQERPLPHEQLAYLNLFMAARHVSESLWAVDQARTKPSFRRDLDDWLEWAGLHVQRFLEA